MTGLRRSAAALLPALVLVGLVAAEGTLQSPDGVEMAAAGRCLWRLPLDAAACDGLEPWFWAPGFPVVAGLVSLVVHPALAALLVGVAGFALATVPLATLARRLGGPTAALLAPLLFLAVPVLQSHALMGEARGLALAALFGGAAVLTRAQATPRQLAGAGALLGLAALTRQEALAPAGLLALFAVARFGLPGLATGGALSALVLPWMGFLSARAGHLVPTPRAWQGAANRWVEALPREWVFAELSAGTRGTPLRSALSQAAVDGPPLALEGLGPWLALALPQAAPWGLALGALLGSGIALRRGSRAALVALALVVAPYLALQALPPARDAMLPANNLLALPLALVPLAAVAAARVLDRLPERARPAVGVGLAVVALGALVALGVDRRARDAPRAFEAAAAWLAAETAPTDTVAASILGAPSALRADRTRRRLAPPYALPATLRGWERPDLILVSNLDLPAARLQIRQLAAAGAAPVARLSHGDDVVQVYRLPPAPGR